MFVYVKIQKWHNLAQHMEYLKVFYMWSFKTFKKIDEK